KKIIQQPGTYFQTDHMGRGLAVGDLDNDGRPDLVISHVNDPIVVLRNVAGDGEKRNHWLGIELSGKDHRDLVGVKLTLKTEGQIQTRFVKGGGSYLSAHDPRHLFGLGKTQKIESLTVTWAPGKTQTWDGAALAVDRYWRLIEGEKAPQAWKGRAA